MDSDRDRIIVSLAEKPQGKTAADLGRALGLSSASATVLLRRLKLDGLVTMVAGKWRVAANAKPLEPSPEVETTIPSSVQPPQGWDILRRVCSYYADCVRRIAGSKIALEEGNAYLDNEIRIPVPWFELSHSSWRAPRTALPVRGKGIGGEKNRRAVLAALIERMPQRRSDQIRWLPILFLPVEVRRHLEHLEFSAIGEVQVNLDWLDAKFPPSEEDAREEFLIQIGLLYERSDFSLEAIRENNLAACWRRVKQALSPDLWLEDRDPANPTSGAPLTKEKRNGIYPRTLLLPEPSIRFEKGLLRDLEAIASATDQTLASTALVPLLAGLMKLPKNEKKDDGHCFRFNSLNPMQQDTVQRALSQRFTVVQGPPGTGKSTVVRNALIALAMQKGSSLFASRNHRAVDAVVSPLNAMYSHTVLVQDLRARKWPEILAGLSRRNGLASAEKGLDRLVAKAKQLLANIQETLQRIETVMKTRDELSEMEIAFSANLDNNELACRAMSEKWSPFSNPSRLIRLDHTARSGPFLLRTLARILMTARGRKELRAVNAEGIPKKKTWKEIGLTAKWQEKKICHDSLEDKIKEGSSLEDLSGSLDTLESNLIQVCRHATELLPEAFLACIQDDTEIVFSLRRLRRALVSGRFTKKTKEFVNNEFRKILKAIPLWATTNLSVPSGLPYAEAAFDLAVVDEAGQCDPASIFPVLFRAKRALIVGDPMQLRPVKRLSRQTEERLRAQHGLTDSRFDRFVYSGNSAYEMAEVAAATANSDVTLLREHYRCHRRIADFFNSEFYDGDLIVRTPPRPSLGRTAKAGMQWTEVPGGSVPVRTSRWHPPQVKAIVEELQQLEQDEFSGTVGVVTPFREHAKRIADLASSSIRPSQLQAWQFVSATADGFQGGEKDIVLLGLVGGGDGPNSTPHFYQRDQFRFNVAVSRARHLLHVFGDSDWASTCGVGVLQRLSRACRLSPAKNSEIRFDLIGPVWEPLLAEEMQKLGIEFHQQYQSCGFHLDFAFFPDATKRDGGNRKINVEVDGETYHRDRDGNLRREDLYRDQILKAAGWTVQRFWVYQLREDLQGCLKKIGTLIR